MKRLLHITGSRNSNTLSLTPRFSGVRGCPRAGHNCFNSFFGNSPGSLNSRISRGLLLVWMASCLLIPGAARAQEEIPIPAFLGGQVKPIWLSVSGINGEALQVLQFDLYVQGFNFTNV